MPVTITTYKTLLYNLGYLDKYYYYYYYPFLKFYYNSKEVKKMKVFIEVILQTFLAFFAILFITRILGRKQLAQLTVHEYINGITFGSIAAALATDINQRTWHHLIGLSIFGLLTYGLSYVCMKNRNASRVLEGESILIIENGRILEDNLKKFHYTVDDLNHLLRKKDIFYIQDVKYGILETTGEISVMKVPEKDYIKASDMSVKPKDEDIPSEIIIAGQIIYENLKKRNVTIKWLLSQLKQMGIKDIREIYFGSVDKDLNIYLDKFEDQLSPKSEL